VPGTILKLSFEINASKELCAARKSNMFIGVDLDGEEDTANTVYLCTEKLKSKLVSNMVFKSHSFPEVTVLK
jgi:hypothetical protein